MLLAGNDIPQLDIVLASTVTDTSLPLISSFGLFCRELFTRLV
jgi:hypothetical protein